MANTDSQRTTPSPVGSTDRVTLSRWVIYCQAILLLLVATSCFTAGMFVGSFSTPPSTKDQQTDFRVSGTISYVARDTSLPDSGAVVLMLPESPKISGRQDPSTITPQNFQPLENPTIDTIRNVGGQVVRANIDGKFEFFSPPGKYQLLVVSNAKADVQRQSLSREQVAFLSQYFLPVESLIVNQDFFWKKINVTIKDVSVDNIEFR